MEILHLIWVGVFFSSNYGHLPFIKHLSLAMIRTALNNQIELTELLRQDTAKLPETTRSVSHAAAAKQKFKARLFLLFGILLTLDIADIVGNIYANLLIDENATSIVMISNMITLPFYISIHIVVLFALLDMFKTEVLKKRESTNHSSVIALKQTVATVILTETSPLDKSTG